MDMPNLANDLLNMNAKFTSEPFIGIPQKPMATICKKCGTEEATLVCRYCGEDKR